MFETRSNKTHDRSMMPEKATIILGRIISSGGLIVNPNAIVVGQAAQI
jgi:filamentous hemagglutinin family protein